MNKLRQAIWVVPTKFFGIFGVELTLTCNFCNQEIEADNYNNHMSYHDKWGHNK